MFAAKSGDFKCMHSTTPSTCEVYTEAKTDVVLHTYKPEVINSRTVCIDKHDEGYACLSIVNGTQTRLKFNLQLGRLYAVTGLIRSTDINFYSPVQ